MRIEQAKAQAQGASNARTQTEREGMGMLGDTINIGRGLPSQGMQYAGQSLAAGQGATNSAGQWQGASNAMGSPTAWMGQSNQAIGTSGNLLSADYNNQMKAYEANQANSPWNIVGGLAGAYAGAGAPGLGAGLAMLAEGGELAIPPPSMQGMHEGMGEVSGPGGPKDDAIPARLSDGEYVIPEEVVRRKGTEFFDKLIAKTKGDLQEREQGAQVYEHAMALPPPEAIA